MVALDTSEFLRTVNNEQDQFYARGTWSPSVERHAELHLPERPHRHQRPPRARHHQRAATAPACRAATATTPTTPGCSATWSWTSATRSTTARCPTSPTIREASNSDLPLAPTCARWPTSSSAAAAATSSTSATPSCIARPLQWNLDRHTLKGGVEFAKNKNFRNGLTVEDTICVLAGAAPVRAVGRGRLQRIAHGPALRPHQPVRLQRVHQHRQRPAQPRLVLRRLRHEPRRHDQRATSWAPRCTSTARRATRTARSTTAASPRSADGPQDTSSKGLSFFAQDTAQFGRLTVNAGRARSSSSSTSTRWARTSSPSTGPWRRASALIYDLKGDGRQKLTALLRQVLRPDPQQHDQLRRLPQRPHA